VRQLYAVRRLPADEWRRLLQIFKKANNLTNTIHDWAQRTFRIVGPDPIPWSFRLGRFRHVGNHSGHNRIRPVRINHLQTTFCFESNALLYSDYLNVKLGHRRVRNWSLRRTSWSNKKISEASTCNCRSSRILLR